MVVAEKIFQKEPKIKKIKKEVQVPGKYVCRYDTKYHIHTKYAAAQSSQR